MQAIGVGTVHVDMLFSVSDPKHPVFHHVFYVPKPTGMMVKVGDKVQNKRYCITLHALALNMMNSKNVCGFI